MLLEEMRNKAKVVRLRRDSKRKKLIKRYEVKITNALRRKVYMTGEISVTVLVPARIYLDITEIFESQGFRVISLGFFGSEDNNVKLIIEDKER